MKAFVIPEPARACIPTVEGQHFPVRRLYCVGRNYAEHAIEMGHDPNQEKPFFFQKNPENLNPTGIFPYPPKSSDVHHEIELLIALHKGGGNIPVDQAMNCVYGYAVCLDMTRRDLQAEMKRLRRPWEIGKAFENSAPVGSLACRKEIGDCEEGQIRLAVNGEIRQSGNLSQMIWKIPELISHLSELYEVAAGDVILSGTPAGVGPVSVGDTIAGSVTGLPDLLVRVTSPKQG